jgi:hypothetical protein
MHRPRAERERGRGDEKEGRDRIEAIRTREKWVIEMARLERAVRGQEEARERARRTYDERRDAAERYRLELKGELVRREEERRIEPLRKLDEMRHFQEMNEDSFKELEG